MRRTKQLRRKQGGAVAIMVGLAIFVLVMVISLVLDLGHLYIAKTELQNSADACALSAASELSDLSGNALGRATNAGIVAGGGCPAGLSPCPDVAFRNKIDLQGAEVNVQPGDIGFASTLAGPYTRPDLLPANTRYVRCAPQETNRVSIVMWLGGVMGVTSGSVRAEAVARLAPSQTACAVPLGLCAKQNSGPNWGFVKGNWYDGRFGSGDGLTGSYNWIDFTPPGGGANELKALLADAGQCEVPTAEEVGGQGEKQGAENAWNTRFGLYKGSYNADENRMDRTGFAYTAKSWLAGESAYPHFLIQRAANTPYQGDASGLKLRGFGTSTSTDHASGGDRRIVAAPVVRCPDWEHNKTIAIKDWACVLMLSPINGPDKVELEFLGMASAVGSPCATFGMPGGGGIGPQVPTLVR